MVDKYSQAEAKLRDLPFREVFEGKGFQGAERTPSVRALGVGGVTSTYTVQGRFP